MRAIIVNSFRHSARILGDACEKMRSFSVEGTRLNRKRIGDMVGRSLMLATALSLVIGYDKASAIAHEAHDCDLTVRESALILMRSALIGSSIRKRRSGAPCS